MTTDKQQANSIEPANDAAVASVNLQCQDECRDAIDTAGQTANVEIEPHGSRESRPLPAAGSSANAVKHGLSAVKHLPDEIEQRHEEIQSRLLKEQQPPSVLEELLWGNIARGFATLEFTQKCEIAALKVGGRNAPKLAEATASETSDTSEISVDDYLTAASSSEFLEKVNRYRRQHESAIFRSFLRLDQIAAKREQREVPKITLSDFRRRFPDTVTCEKYLRSRVESSEWRCPRCSSRSPQHWLKTRHCWECPQCGAQFSLRHSTIMEGSRLPLDSWFLAIGLICIDQTTTAAQIAETLGLNRMATARRMLAAILSALRSPNRDERLMGLPAVVFDNVRMPEPSARFDSVLRNESASVPNRSMLETGDPTRPKLNG